MSLRRASIRKKKALHVIAKERSDRGNLYSCGGRGAYSLRSEVEKSGHAIVGVFPLETRFLRYVMLRTTSVEMTD